ncbi:hypothetical protein HY990_03640 [Candidatus Micrarchaeota archaeon]|nr:hypothetical protein [Candidatus Micrarchaeota archaeon]
MRSNLLSVLLFVSLLLIGCTQSNSKIENNQTVNLNQENFSIQTGCLYQNPVCSSNQQCINNTCISLSVSNPPNFTLPTDYCNYSCAGNEICSDNRCVTYSTQPNQGNHCPETDSRVDDLLQSISISRVDGTMTDACEVVSYLLSTYNGFDDNSLKEQRINSVLSKYDFSKLDDESRLTIRQKLIVITNSIWVDKNNLVPWSLKDYSQDQLDSLFYVAPGWDVPNGFLLNKPTLPLDGSYYTGEYYGTPQIREDSAYKLTNLAYKLHKSNQTSTITSILSWQEQNFFHAYVDGDENWSWDVYLDGRPSSQSWTDMTPLSLDRLFEERITGCHENSLLYSSLLKSINIPAEDISVQGHGVVYLPTLDRYVHGDHIADFVFVPSEKLLLRTDEIIKISTGGPAGYDRVVADQYERQPYPRYLIGNQGAKHRNNNNSLFLKVDYVRDMIPSEQLTQMQSQVPQFNLHYDAREDVLYSDPHAIQPLSELSK